jgi:hypothetical protein
MRMSNLSSLDNDDLQPSNLPDTLMRLEEANLEGGNSRGGGSDSLKSSNSDQQQPQLDPQASVGLARLGSKVISMKSGSYISAPPVVNICLDITTNQVTEMYPTTGKSELLNKNEPAPASVPSMMTKLKSAATVMQSSVMGFGFGLGVTEPTPTTEPDTRR